MCMVSMWWHCLALRRTDDPERSLAYGGPFRDRLSYEEYRQREPVKVAASEFSSWSDDASFPQLPAHPRALKRVPHNCV